MEIAVKSTDIDLSRFSFEALQQMRDAYPGMNDSDLSRFLIARNGDVDKAKDFLNQHLRWKSENEQVPKHLVLHQLKKGVVYFNGCDLEGHPLMIVRAANHDPYDRDINDVIRAQLWIIDHLIAKLPDDKSKYTILFDRTDSGLANQDITCNKEVIATTQANFPERLHRAIVYPSGMVFYAAWNLIKVFIDPVTREKCSPCMYYSGVTHYIDPEYIPQRMGGNCTYEPDFDSMEDAPWAFGHYPSDLTGTDTKETTQDTSDDGN